MFAIEVPTIQSPKNVFELYRESPVLFQKLKLNIGLVPWFFGLLRNSIKPTCMSNASHACLMYNALLRKEVLRWVVISTVPERVSLRSFLFFWLEF